ncbi:MAG: hypothetical protein NPIRA02_04230 [Nitrospirales bacterium]|nr:MAG: hypothetical protein NPIRA02_04230 [Nitrospirales bacterium]
MESDHGKVSHASVQAFLVEVGFDRTAAKFAATVLGAHHGRLNRPNDRGYCPPGLISDSKSQIDWEAERRIHAQKIWDYFKVNDTTIELNDSSPSLWWLAGLTSVADWIGSDERFFSPEVKTEAVDTPSVAQNALESIGIRKTEFIPNLSFHELFHDAEKPEKCWVPNEMQEKTLTIVNAPGVYVIEAPMGIGKTEAALWAAYQILVSKKATGIYFALPTQATSNRMHIRMNEFIRRISTTPNTSRLIHGNSWLMDQISELSPVATSDDSASDDARTGRDWFASTKRALIASFGVGTIDQALLGIVAAKHFFVRHFALAGKVVILDEIHSYDVYTGTLIDKLIATLEALGCTVLILSATLTGKRRGKIISCVEDTKEEALLPYPLIIGRKGNCTLNPVAVTPPESRTVEVGFISYENAIDEAIMAAKKGGTVLWICNTVNEAQKQYRQFKKVTHEDSPLGLLHSRFPFWRREKIEEEWMERFGKSGTTRCGAILVSTQIVEQSVDLDADLMITELAPTDMLLQRMGRLYRHERTLRPLGSPKFCILAEEKSLEDFKNLSPKAILDALGSKARVYAPFVLLRSLEVWKGIQEEITLPTQIRELMESTYRTREREPDSWEKLFEQWFGTESARKMEASRNCNIWQVALDDEEGVQTRLNDLPTIPLVLCLSLNDQEAIFIDESKGTLGSDQYRLHTKQAIHKNLINVPEYCFDELQLHSGIRDYLFGKQSVGIVTESGTVEVTGLKNGTQLFYSDELGLVIEQSA